MKDHPHDKTLILRIRTEKSQDAYAALYDKYVERIYRFVYLKVSSKEYAEDITSDVFLKTWNYLVGPSGKEIKSFSGLVYRIARNRVVDFYRERGRRQQQEQPIEELASDPSVRASQEKDVDTIIEHDSIVATIMQLKQEYQDIIFLKHVEELSTREIAEILGKKQTAVRVTLHRAMKVLREMTETK